MPEPAPCLRVNLAFVAVLLYRLCFPSSKRSPLECAWFTACDPFLSRQSTIHCVPCIIAFISHCCTRLSRTLCDERFLVYKRSVFFSRTSPPFPRGLSCTARYAVPLSCCCGQYVLLYCIVTGVHTVLHLPHRCLVLPFSVCVCTTPLFTAVLRYAFILECVFCLYSTHCYATPHYVGSCNPSVRTRTLAPPAAV